MQITLDQVGKHFNFSWVFKKLDYTFEAPGIYAIVGNNGSGKSTLLQILSGFLSPSTGRLVYSHNDQSIYSEDLYRYLTLTTPHLELLEEFTLKEQIDFQTRFKNPLPGLDASTIMDICGLKKHRNKALKHFSSGMRQRLRLALAFLFESKLILLDEPTSHLDRNGIEWYKDLSHNYQENRLLIISSNVKEEYEFSDQTLAMEDYHT